MWERGDQGLWSCFRFLDVVRGVHNELVGQCIGSTGLLSFWIFFFLVYRVGHLYIDLGEVCTWAEDVAATKNLSYNERIASALVAPLDIDSSDVVIYNPSHKHRTLAVFPMTSYPRIASKEE